MVRQGSSSASHIWMHTWEVVWEFYSGPFHRYREIDEKNLHCFFMSSYLKAWEQKLWQLLLRCLEISPENFGLHHTIHLSVYHEPRTKVKAFGNWAVVGYQPWPVLVLLPLVPHLVPSYCAGQGPAGWERAIAVLPSQLWRAEHSSRLGEGLKVEMVSQERCVSQEELLALLGLQKVMPGMGSGLTHLLVCQRSLHRAETCVGTDSLAGMYLHWHLQGCPLSCFLSLQFLVCAKCIFLIFSRQQYSVCRFCFFRQ